MLKLPAACDCVLPSLGDLQTSNIQPRQWRAGWESIATRLLIHQSLLLLAPACWWALQALLGCRKPDPPDTGTQMLFGGTEAPQHPALGCLGILGFITQLQACSGFVQPRASRHFSNPSSAGRCPAPQHPSPKRPQHPQLLHTQENPGHPRLRACLISYCTWGSPLLDGLGLMGRYCCAGLGDPYLRVLAHLLGLWDGCVCSSWCSESLLCFVCPRQLCWIQLRAVLHLTCL